MNNNHNSIYGYILLGLVAAIYINYSYHNTEGFAMTFQIPFFIGRIDKKGPSTISGVPLVIYNSWHSNSVPQKMKENIDVLLKRNPEFDYYLYSDDASRAFIKNNFDEDVVMAFDILKPGAYKSDLWRYCILYKEGGVYIDIKFNTMEPLIRIVERSPTLYVNDIDVTENNVDGCMYNGFMISPPYNQIFKDCIDEIVDSCQKRLYRKNSLDITGPCLLGRIIKKYDVNLRNYNNYTYEDTSIPFRRNMIKHNNNIILESYPEYRNEQSQYQKNEHYGRLWANHDIYNKMKK